MWRVLPLLLLLGCRPDCKEAVGHGMDLVDQELHQTLAHEPEERHSLALAEARKTRSEAMKRCEDHSMSKEQYRCTMAARSFGELARCPGWE